MRLVIIDGQGGGFGCALIESLRRSSAACEIIAVGTNSLATSAMLKAGANAGATGENAAVVNARRADIIAGPIGLIVANSMLGECSPAIALAVAESRAKKILIPVTTCGVLVAGLPEKALSAYIADAAALILSLLAPR
ncbi:MAG: DUF3842 family protein [Ruthenibacterium sp.]